MKNCYIVIFCLIICLSMYHATTYMMDTSKKKLKRTILVLPVQRSKFHPEVGYILPGSTDILYATKPSEGYKRCTFTKDSITYSWIEHTDETSMPVLHVTLDFVKSHRRVYSKTYGKEWECMTYSDDNSYEQYPADIKDMLYSWVRHEGPNKWRTLSLKTDMRSSQGAIHLLS